MESGTSTKTKVSNIGPETIKIIDALPFYVLLVNEDHRILGANKTMRDALGLNSDQLVGCYCPKVVHGLEEPFSGCPLEEAVRKNTAVEKEIFDEKTGRWLLSAAYPTNLRGEDGKIVYFHTVQDITEQKSSEHELRFNFQNQKTLGQLLRIALLNVSLEEQLEVFLKQVLDIPWLGLLCKGAIFLIEDDPKVLIMKANIGLASPLLTACAKVPFGYCLCGRAAESRKIEFANCLDDRHDITYDGILPHGHFCVPVLSGGALLGVINLYVNEGLDQDRGKEDFLSAVANVLAGIIKRKKAEQESKVLHQELAQAQKLEAIGGLAAGIAHEINTPTQYVGDNIRFLQEAMEDLNAALRKFDQLLTAVRDGDVPDRLVEEAEKLIEQADLEYLEEEVPNAIKQSLEGIDRVSRIVRAMKEFSHPGTGEKTTIDINKAIENTITVARNEWKYVADMETELDPELPLVPCVPSDFNQVILNLITNAAHAIREALGDSPDKKGTIKITTGKTNGHIDIRVADTGTGIPEEIRDKIFDPFFTTKEVGRGTGQGLPIIRTSVVEKHQGMITFETELGRGTTFIIRLPHSLDQNGNGAR